MDKEQQTAMNKAIRLLAMRAHGTTELRGKLYDKGYTRPIVEFVIAECTRLKFLDDRSFAEMYLQELQSRGYGARKCRMSMQRKRLDEELIDELLSEASQEEEIERASVLLERKLKSLSRETDPRKKKEKALRFMISRGFSPSLVFDLFRKLTEQ